MQCASRKDFIWERCNMTVDVWSIASSVRREFKFLFSLWSGMFCMNHLYQEYNSDKVVAG